MSDMPPQVDRAAAENAVKVPAIGLIVMGAIGTLAMVRGLMTGGVDAAALEQVPEGLRGVFTALGMMFPILFLLLNLLVLVGGLKMKALKSRGLAMTACVLAIVNLGCCCISAIFGIWGLVAMSKPEVKAAFEP